MKSGWLWGMVDFFRQISESNKIDLENWSIGRSSSVSVFAHILHCRLIAEISFQSVNVIGMISCWMSLMSTSNNVVSQVGLAAFWGSIFLRSLAYQVSASAFLLSSGDEFVEKNGHNSNGKAKNRFGISRKIKSGASLAQFVGLYAFAIVFMRQSGWYHW